MPMFEGDTGRSGRLSTLPIDSATVQSIKTTILRKEMKEQRNYASVSYSENIGWVIGPYRLTSESIFQWISHLTDDDIEEIQNVENSLRYVRYSTACGGKQEMLGSVVRAGTGRLLLQIRALIMALEDIELDKEAVDQIVDFLLEPPVRKFMELIGSLQPSAPAPDSEALSQHFTAFLQELIARDLIEAIVETAVNPKTGKVDIDTVVEMVHLREIVA
ncbi:hypothetical protein BH10CYA1_BH10CYA1_18350 [soil metagenome]